jgi:hypothetical protein
VATGDRYRAAAHESVFRSVNESIERGQWPGDDSDAVAFRCECARLGCNELVPLTRGAYEQVRANPRWFVMAAGHQMPRVETVVSTHPGYIVVEKRGDAGDLAETMDPRS